MIEKEERYLEALRGQLARSSDEKKILELEKAERNLQKLQGMLQNHVRNQNEVNMYNSVRRFHIMLIAVFKFFQTYFKLQLFELH